MLPNLFWFPNVIICNGWTSALVPFLIKKLAENDKDLSKIKTIYSTNSLNKDVLFDSSNLPFNIETKKEIKSYNLNQIGCAYADATIVVDDEEKVSGNIMKSNIFKNSKSCSTVDLTKSDGDSSALLDEIEKVLRLYNHMFRFILDAKKLLILMIFIVSCSEETIIYDEIENKDSTIQT